MNQYAILANQREQLSLLRQIASTTRGRDGVDVIEDVLPEPLGSVEDLEEFSSRLREISFRDKFVST